MEKSRRLDLNAFLSYSDILAQWQKRKPGPVFVGHFLYSFVTETNQIENIDVSYNTTRELFESEQLVGYHGDFRAAMSVLNNRNVASYLETQLKSKASISKELILEVHRLLMFASMDRHRYEDNGERAGTFKQKDYCVGRYDVGSLPQDVPGDIDVLCHFINSKFGEVNILKLASAFQCMFEGIHPFADGNGRVGRWLTNYMLVLGGHPPVLFRREERQAYYDVLERYDSQEEYEPMRRYLEQQTVLSWPALREVV